MRLPYAVGRVFASSLPRRLSVACAAVSLVLGGCSTYEAGTPKGSANYIEPRPAASNQQTSFPFQNAIPGNRPLNHPEPEYRWFYDK
jgi:hypothetical protein